MAKARAIAGVIAAATVAVLCTAPATAQDRFEANTQGYRGGYSTFGGYYDTFGGYGGQYGYGYRRYNSIVSPTATFLAVPVLGASDKQVEPCAWLRQRAKATGARKWKARYAACRSGN